MGNWSKPEAHSAPPSTFPTPNTKFLDGKYDVYRATGTVIGRIPWNGGTVVKDWKDGANVPGRRSDAASRYIVKFGTPTRIEHHLDDGYATLADCEGLAVETAIWLPYEAGLIGDTAYNYILSNRIALCGVTSVGENVSADDIKDTLNLGLSSVRYYDNLNDYKGNDFATAWADYCCEAWKTPRSLAYAAHRTFFPQRANDVADAILNGSVLFNVPYGDGHAQIGERAWISMSKWYADIVVGKPAPLAENQLPGGGYIYPYAEQKVNWSIKETSVYYGVGWSAPKASAAESAYGGIILPWDHTDLAYSKPDGTALAAVTEAGATASSVIPTAVLEEDSFNWTAKVTTGYGAEVQFPSVALNTVDSIPTVKAVSPINVLVNATEGATFDWDYSIDTGTAPTGYEFQTRTGATWTTLASATGTDATEVTIPAEQLATTMDAWRIRSCNSDGTYSEYCDAAEVTIRVAPKVLTLNASGSTKPLVEWQANDQQGFEVKVDSSTSGIVYGSTKKYQWPETLADGTYTISVRVVNQYGLYSDWRSISFTAKNTLPYDEFSVAAAQSGADITLTWSAGGDHAEIYRDGERIATTTATEWVDHYATGEHTYFVRLIADSGDYTDSTSATITLNLGSAVIAQVGVWTWRALKWVTGNDMPSRSSNYAPIYALSYYSGSVLPQAEISEHRSRSHTIRYTVTPAEAAQLLLLSGRQVVFKRTGELIEGMVTAISETRTWDGSTMSITITEVV